ncbi:hypothetical protein CO058_02540 [candidate division WWE3 bacterium CG_4_9_14_0_2_um_filter_35_11]|uniref:Uncharacterized protein n=1 Tax=candidate division WWE3 bacterium CG_4_9_14_0_2_um_filter_35_11 TaxID=1975077 RepID=A0A2M8ELJ7_UNCKA|nr:MAG: hypothetical protein CO058_02540 [candidate division WWE3 bacterium CG_4_9_14_0_2_um_filter_35_11]
MEQLIRGVRKKNYNINTITRTGGIRREVENLMFLQEISNMAPVPDSSGHIYSKDELVNLADLIISGILSINGITRNKGVREMVFSYTEKLKNNDR